MHLIPFISLHLRINEQKVDWSQQEHNALINPRPTFNLISGTQLYVRNHKSSRRSVKL